MPAEYVSTIRAGCNASTQRDCRFGSRDRLCVSVAWAKSATLVTPQRVGVFCIPIEPPATEAAHRIGETTYCRLGDDADANLALLDKADHHGELAVLASEPACAVDWIDNPEPLAGVSGGLHGCRCFLRAQRIVWKRLADRFQDDLLRLPIGIGGDVGGGIRDDLKTGIFLHQMCARPAGGIQRDF